MTGDAECGPSVVASLGVFVPHDDALYLEPVLQLHKQLDSVAVFRNVRVGNFRRERAAVHCDRSFQTLRHRFVAVRVTVDVERRLYFCN